jgi:hypothetical protein
MILGAVFRFPLLIVLGSFILLINEASCRKHHPLDAPSIHVPNDEIRSILKEIRAAPSLSSSSSSTTTTTTTTTTSQQRADGPRKNRSALDYSIFRGQGSSLRNLPIKQRKWIERFEKSLAALLLLVLHGSLSSSEASSLVLDAAHEVILGVRPDDEDIIKEAEFAATHPGQTKWMQNHPLSDVDDWIHSIIHRQEGDAIGEGNHTGWDNAKYWAAGGPKQLYSSSSSSDDDDANTDDDNNDTANTGNSVDDAVTSSRNGRKTEHHHHVIAQELAQLARQFAPLCVKAGVVTSCRTQHVIFAGNGHQKRRIVSIPANCWDPFCFINLLSSFSARLPQEREELNILLQAELDLLLEHAAAAKTNTIAIEQD